MKKPCDETCAKCGSTDADLTWRQAGQSWMPTWSEFTTCLDGPYVEQLSGRYRCVAKQECIVHHCQKCMYEWVGPVMPEPETKG